MLPLCWNERVAVDVEPFVQPQQPNSSGWKGGLRKAREGGGGWGVLKEPLYTWWFHLWDEQGVKTYLRESKGYRNLSKEARNSEGIKV